MLKLQRKFVNLGTECCSRVLTNKRLFSSNTIFSLSSGQGKCGVSIIRVSGEKSFDALKSMCGGENFQPKPRLASLKAICHPKTKEIIDYGLVLWFPGPKSFTGEDSCEFQVHGSIAVVTAVLEALSNVPGLRSAKPGEFTKRAFFNGKMDLTEVDGLADLIHAETEAQRKQALLQSTGSLSRVYTMWRQKIIRNIAHMEAYIDFAEDENIETNIIETIIEELTKVVSDIKEHLNDHRQGEVLRNGIRTAVIGEPNVGKSSFLNLIVQRKVSIVTDIAGTTRDIIESSQNISGYPVIFADTAGLRSKTDDIIEKEGIEMAKDYIKKSDFVILLIDAKDIIPDILAGKIFNEYRIKYLKRLGLDEDDFNTRNQMIVINKIDLLQNEDIKKLSQFKECNLISCIENTNIDLCLNKMTERFNELCGQPSVENPRLTQSRYRENLLECQRHLEDFLSDTKNFSMIDNHNIDLAIIAQKLRKSVRCIEIITGDVSNEEILDVIFKDFCIGK